MSESTALDTDRLVLAERYAVVAYLDRWANERDAQAVNNVRAGLYFCATSDHEHARVLRMAANRIRRGVHVGRNYGGE